MQMVILAGGAATRLGALTQQTAKGMLPIAGKPFLLYQLELLKRSGVEDVLFCIGHLGEQIREYFGDGKRLGLKIAYSQETGTLLGTGGCLKNAERLLNDTFMVMYGDTYLRIDYALIWKAHEAHPQDGLMVVYRNENLYDRSNLIVENGFVTEYSYEPSAKRVYIDYGVSVLNRTVLNPYQSGQVFGLQEIFQKLIREKKLRAFEAHERFYEIGSRQGLETFTAFIQGEKR